MKKKLPKSFFIKNENNPKRTAKIESYLWDNNDDVLTINLSELDFILRIVTRVFLGNTE